VENLGNVWGICRRGLSPLGLEIGWARELDSAELSLARFGSFGPLDWIPGFWCWTDGMASCYELGQWSLVLLVWLGWAALNERQYLGSSATSLYTRWPV
jgi:hypothetical protein